MKSNQMHVESEAEAQEEEVEFVINEIEKLQEFGINVADINKLKSSGYCTVSSILMATKKDLNIELLRQLDQLRQGLAQHLLSLRKFASATKINSKERHYRVND